MDNTNFIEQIADMLGIDVEEEFYVPNIEGRCKLTLDNGLVTYSAEDQSWTPACETFNNILCGRVKIALDESTLTEQLVLGEVELNDGEFDLGPAIEEAEKREDEINSQLEASLKTGLEINGEERDDEFADQLDKIKILKEQLVLEEF